MQLAQEPWRASCTQARKLTWVKVGKSLGREAEVKGQVEALLAREKPNGPINRTLKGR